MSSTAAVRQSRPSFLAPAIERARLRVVPRLRPGRTTARRMPFVGLVSVLLISGVVGLLIFNTSMQQAAFSEQSLQQQADTLAARQEALATQLQILDDPQHVAAQAQAQGMVIPDTPALLKVPSGKVLGTATAADGLATPQLWAHNPAPKVTPRIVHVTTTGTQRTRGTHTARDRSHHAH